MNNQGLEALAALASAAPASTTANRTEGGGDSKNANIEENRDTTSGGDSTPAIAMDGSVAATAANLSAAAQLVASLQQQNQAATPPQPTLQPQQHVHPINLAAAAAQSQFNNAAAAAASSASPELAFLQQLQRTTTPAADQNMAVMMQNLAYYQLLLHNQAQQQQEVQNLPSTLATLLAMNQGGNVTGHTASHTLLTRPSSSPETGKYVRSLLPQLHKTGVRCHVATLQLCTQTFCVLNKECPREAPYQKLHPMSPYA